MLGYTITQWIFKTGSKMSVLAIVVVCACLILTASCHKSKSSFPEKSTTILIDFRDKLVGQYSGTERTITCTSIGPGQITQDTAYSIMTVTVTKKDPYPSNNISCAGDVVPLSIDQSGNIYSEGYHNMLFWGDNLKVESSNTGTGSVQYYYLFTGKKIN